MQNYHKNQKADLDRDGAGINVAELLLTDVDVFVHLNCDVKTFIYYFPEVMKNTFGLNGTIPVPSQLVLTVMESKSIHGGINAALDHFVNDDRCLDRNMVILNTKENIFADNTFGPCKVKRC